MQIINGVVSKGLKMIADERGWLMEILRGDWEIFTKIGQVYLTAVYPNVVKAWHYHKEQSDFFVCVDGMVKLVLYDSRKDSETYGLINEFVIGEKEPLAIRIPPYVYHGFKGIGQKTALIINIPDKLYNHDAPDEFRLLPDSKDVPYDWGLMPGLKHG